MKVKVKRELENAIIPSYKHEGDSGFDLHSTESIHLEPGERKVISTGLSFEIPLGYELQVRSRSGLSSKYGIIVLNSPGTVDSCYRGIVSIPLMNVSKSTFKIETGDRIAQGIVTPVIQAEFVESDSLSDTSRGQSGFGSTGISTGRVKTPDSY